MADESSDPQTSGTQTADAGTASQPETEMRRLIRQEVAAAVAAALAEVPRTGVPPPTTGMCQYVYLLMHTPASVARALPAYAVYFS